MDFSTADGINIAEKFRKWKQTMDLYLTLAVLEKSEKDKCGTFLYMIGQTGRDIYDTMTFAEKEESKLDVLFTKFDTYCKPKQNITVKRYHFNMRAQEANKTINQYVTELKLITTNCMVS